MVSKEYCDALLARVEALERLKSPSELEKLEREMQSELEKCKLNLKLADKKFLEYDTQIARIEGIAKDTERKTLTDLQYDGILKYINHTDDHDNLEKKLTKQFDSELATEFKHLRDDLWDSFQALLGDVCQKFIISSVYEQDLEETQKEIKKLQDEISQLKELLNGQKEAKKRTLSGTKTTEASSPAKKKKKN
jgi:hypothetical protein